MDFAFCEYLAFLDRLFLSTRANKALLNTYLIDIPWWSPVLAAIWTFLAVNEGNKTKTTELNKIANKTLITAGSKESSTSRQSLTEIDPFESRRLTIVNKPQLKALSTYHQANMLYHVEEVTCLRSKSFCRKQQRYFQGTTWIQKI